jgi:ubiquinone biosynthesis protein
MLHLATLMERHIEELALQRPVKIVEEFARALEKEMDYAIEASSMERVASQFLDDDTVYIPKVYRELTTCCVLTAEYVNGIKISDIDKLKKAELDIGTITKRGADFLLKQVFENGFFHADLHPGNMFVLPENVICFIDFGMTGSVDQQTRDDFVDLMDNIIHQNESKTTETILKLTYWDEEPDIRRLEEEVADFMAKHFYKQLKDIEISKLMQELLELVSRHTLRIPSNIYLMMRALGVVEGVALLLDPAFDMIAHTEPFIRRIKLARYSPQRVASDILRVSSELMQFLHQFPKDTMEIMRLVRQRKITLRFEHQGLENMLATHDQISNRISFSIIIAALLIGSALIVISEIPPMIYGISLIGIIGFLAAAIMGIWLLIAILKKGRL